MLGLEAKREKSQSPKARPARLSNDVRYGDPSQNRTVTDEMRSSCAARETGTTTLLDDIGPLAAVDPGNVRDDADRRPRAGPCRRRRSFQRATGCSGWLG
jgi:hypothetical protein